MIGHAVVTTRDMVVLTVADPDSPSVSSAFPGKCRWVSFLLSASRPSRAASTSLLDVLSVRPRLFDCSLNERVDRVDELVV